MSRNALDVLSEEMFWYSVGFIKLEKKGDEEVPELQGSGVLVQYDSFYRILTAAHVAQKLATLDFIGLVYSEQATRVAYKKDAFGIDLIMYEENQKYGPDLAIVSPPIKLLNELKAKKSFVNLKNRPEQLDHIAGDQFAPVWSIMGAVHELSTHVGQGHDLRAMLMSYFCREPVFKSQNGYDLFEVGAEYSAETGSPNSFEGVSGGGLWKAVLEVHANEAKIREHPKLMGIAFYQEDNVNNERIIRGHGPSSVYDLVCHFLTKS